MILILDLCLEVVSKSSQPLRYIRRWISTKPLEIEAWFQKTTNRKWHMDYQITMTSRDPRRCCEAVRSAILATGWLLVFVTEFATNALQLLQVCKLTRSRHSQLLRDTILRW